MDRPVEPTARMFERMVRIIVAVAFLLCVIPGVAWAEDDDVFLAAFMDRWDWCSDNVYVSYDGKTFELLSTPFKAIDQNGRIDSGTSWGVYSLHDPGIAYRDGIFWMLSGYVDRGTFKANFASSTDLVNWTYPAPPEGFDGTLDVWPPVPEEKYASGRIERGTYDAAAPDFMIDDNGDCWVVACLGYFGIFHGEDGVDFVQPYICKVTGLARNYYNDHYAPWWEGPGDYDLQASPQGTSTQMKRINLPFSSNNWIDSSLYKENGKYYLSIKRDGVTNMVFSIDNLDRAGDRNAWTLVNGDVCTGFEGPCLTKGKDLFGNRDMYFYYTDGLEKEGNPTGIYWQTSDSIGGRWSRPQRIITKDVYGNSIPTRHGSVIRITDPEAKQTILNLRDSLGYTRFTDVIGVGTAEPPNTPHVADILWLADEGITTGYPDHTFGGTIPVFRQDMAAFLYRLAGKPDYEVTQADLDHFTDVTEETPHYKEVCWLAHAGISTGWEEGDGTFTFRPKDTVKRQDMAAFLHRLSIYLLRQYSPEGSSDNIFVDVNESTSHYEHIIWLASMEVTTGWDLPTGREFRGMKDVIRQDMAAFLHRMRVNVLDKPVILPTSEGDDEQVAVQSEVAPIEEQEAAVEQEAAEEPVVESDDSTIDS